MDEQRDAYGQELHSFYLGENKYEVIEREDGLVDVADASVYFSKYAQWSPHERKAMRYVRGRVLDVGCGAGRHALYLQEKGYDVVGIDASPLAVKVCRLRGLKQARVMSVTQVSSKLGSFDTIVMLGNNFGLMSNRVRAKWLLKRFHGMTGPDGRMIVETLDPYQTTDPVHLTYHRQNLKRGRMGGQARIRVRCRQYTGLWMDYLFVSKQELEDLLEDTGWEIGRYLDSTGAGYIAVLNSSCVR